MNIVVRPHVALGPPSIGGPDSVLILLIRVNVPPALLRQESEFLIADVTATIFVHIPEKLLDVVERDLQAEEVDSLSELINRDRLRVISVDVAEGLAQVPETLIDLE